MTNEELKQLKNKLSQEFPGFSKTEILFLHDLIDGYIKKNKKRAFKAPTVEEINQALKDFKKDNPIYIIKFSASKFHSYYEARGWKIANRYIWNWKASLVSWIESDNVGVQEQIARTQEENRIKQIKDPEERQKAIEDFNKGKNPCDMFNGGFDEILDKNHYTSDAAKTAMKREYNGGFDELE